MMGNEERGAESTGMDDSAEQLTDARIIAPAGALRNKCVLAYGQEVRHGDL